jgi:hypothetical protein
LLSFQLNWPQRLWTPSAGDERIPPDFFLTACPDTKAISTIIRSRRLQPAPKESLGEDINQRRLKPAATEITTEITEVELNLIRTETGTGRSLCRGLSVKRG